MKIAIFSDSHGNTKNIKNALKNNTGIDEVFHLGDHVRDIFSIKKFIDVPITVVKGNCDHLEAPIEVVVELAGKRIMLTHGHKYAIKSSLDRLYYAALEKQAQIVIFGHSHIPYYEEIEGVLFINPGSIGDKRWQPHESYAMMFIDGEEIHVQMHEIP